MASFGVVGSKKKEFCAQHKVPGMVNISKSRCGYEGCSTTPSFGFQKSKKREFCAKHAADGMVSFNLDQRSNARRTSKARVPRVPPRNREDTASGKRSLVEVADGT